MRRSHVSSIIVGGFLGCILSSLSASADVVDASKTDSKEDALEEITVNAQRATLEMARDAQREAPNLINLITADEMQKLPDVNTGEAVRRVPGI